MEAAIQNLVRMIVAALVVASGMSAVVSLSVTRAAGQAARATRTADRQAGLQRYLAGVQRGELGPAGPRGAGRHGDAAGRVSV